MDETQRDQLIRRYAAGDITWHMLQEQGFEDYVEVLAALGERGLRPPLARMEGPNLAARQRGLAVLREALRASGCGRSCGAAGRTAKQHGSRGAAAMSEPARAQKAFPVSWDQFHRDARALAWRLSGAGPFHAIVAVTRGGLVPAAIVARELGIRVIETVGVASYHDYQTQGDVAVIKPIGEKLAAHDQGGAGILIVDDLVDTGKTARIVRELIPRAHFATVYAKPMGRPLVDTFITEVSQDTWIYFPWDLGYSFQPPISDGAPG